MILALKYYKIISKNYVIHVYIYLSKLITSLKKKTLTNWKYISYTSNTIENIS